MSQRRAPSPNARNVSSAALVGFGVRPGPSGHGGSWASSICGLPGEERRCRATSTGPAGPQLHSNDLVSIDTHPHRLIGQPVGDRVGDPAVADRRRPTDPSGLAEHARVGPFGEPVQPGLFLDQHRRRRAPGHLMIPTVDLGHERVARLDQLGPQPVGRSQACIGRDQISRRDPHGCFDASPRFGIGRNARLDRDPVVTDDGNHLRMSDHDPRDVAGGDGPFVVSQPVGRHTSEGAHRPIETADRGGQLGFPDPDHHPEPRPRQPGPEQQRRPPPTLGPVPQSQCAHVPGSTIQGRYTRRRPRRWFAFTSAPARRTVRSDPVNPAPATCRSTHRRGSCPRCAPPTPRSSPGTDR